MKQRLIVVGMAGVLVALAALVFGGAQYIAEARVTRGANAQVREVFDRTNQLRLQVGLPTLRFNDALALAAYDQAAYQVVHTWWGHIRPDGSRPSDRATLAGYGNAIRCCGENYYMGVSADANVVWDFWINSPDHYNNLTNPWYNDLGVAVATDGYRNSYVMVFGVGPAVPVASAPPVRFDATIQTGVETTSITYTVTRGDTMQAIARAHGVTIDAIARASNIANPDRLMPGDVLTIPGVAPLFLPAMQPVGGDPSVAPSPGDPSVAPTTGATGTHTVARGENLYRIALRYGVTVAALSTANGISDPTRIYVGQVLTIPGR
jgi:uncharacterized protein YkwD/LysM repeat protein